MEMKSRGGRKPGSINLPDEIKKSIAFMKSREPDITAKEIQKRLSTWLQDPEYKRKWLSDKYKNHKFPKGYPSQSKVEKELAGQSEILKKHPEIKEFDKPWSMGAVDRYPYLFTPEGISAILRVLKWCIEIGGYPRIKRLTWRVLHLAQELYPNKVEILKPIPVEQEQYLSIRDAKWIARLSSSISDTGRLEMIATLYSDLERLSLLTGKVFDSADIDEDLVINEFHPQPPFETTLKDWLKKNEEAQNEGAHNKEG